MSTVDSFRNLPKTLRLTIATGWGAAPLLVIAAGVISVVSGILTAFGLLATADALSVLLRTTITPERISESIPEVSLVLVIYSARALIESLERTVEASVRPHVACAAENNLARVVSGIDVIAFEDASFRELAAQGGQAGVRALANSVTPLLGLLSSIATVTASVVATSLFHPLLAIGVVVACVPSAWAASRSSRLNNLHMLGTVSDHLQKSILAEISTDSRFAMERAVFGLRDRLIVEYELVSKRLCQKEITSGLKRARIQLAGRALSGLSGAVAFGVLAILLYTRWIDVAVAGAAAVAMRVSITSVTGAAGRLYNLFELGFSIELYKDLLRGAAERRRSVGSVAFLETGPDIITMSAVGFCYPGHSRPSLCDINLTIGRGEVVAIVGRNGSGKSTLAKIIGGLYVPSIGKVFWNSVDLAYVRENDIRKNVSFVAQTPMAWPTTAGNNVEIGCHADLPIKEWWDRSLKVSGAGDVIDSLPHKMETLLSTRFVDGRDLSVGQWQRLAIARALVRNGSILIADEATSALDPHAESQVLEFLTSSKESMNQVTTIFVTHRILNARKADRIVVMEGGRIVETGSHNELMQNPEGHYRLMYEVQVPPINTRG
ncbi:ATP-binding cassette domain-containing protein [Nocardia tenerifensis]|uniref:ATP-binding cassette domain-containing protein n=1 Tax=Nocardia tenerifensis TaxID=228006 RepID=UPI0012F66359|nr:ATP-binding cassette domain-containing protein [Nocardia tenerifensis]